MKAIGSGPPLVLVPGVQGRWEWMRPAVDALARHFRVITFSLVGERRSGMALDEAVGFDSHVDQLDGILAQAGVERTLLCGVSFGGLIALRYAAVRPERVAGLVLVSTPGPGWKPTERQQAYVHAPRTSVIKFVGGAPGRLWREIHAALPGPAERWRTAAGYLAAILSAPASGVRMARRVQLVANCDLRADAASIAVPTLVVTGEPELDRVVPVAGTREYLGLIPGAVGRTLEHTGHIGLITKPELFAAVLHDFSVSTRSR
ncbi:MAG TPA: alpha/beta hydrolase [Vicinamibacterales bacterium]|jgi:pimeloyl-ACP methyl ester carboxylesterase